MNNEKRFVLVTGATSGIGKATVKRLHGEGWQVIAAGRNREVLNELYDNKLAFATIEGDLADDGVAREVVDTALEHSDGKLHGLVNAAGILTTGAIDVETDEGFDRQININLNASFRVLSQAWEALKKVKGAVVLVSSVTGLRAFPGLVGYCVSKAGVDQLVRCAALDGAPYGVRVNGINPGVVVTELHKRGGMPEENYPGFLEHSKTTHPLGRVGNVDEIAAAISYLLGNEAAWVTGVSLPLDGGRQLTCAR